MQNPTESAHQQRLLSRLNASRRGPLPLGARAMSAILSPRHAQAQAEDGDAEMDSVVPLVVAEVGAANAPAEAAKKKSQLRISADKLGLAGLDAQHVSGELLEELYEEEVGLWSYFTLLRAGPQSSPTTLPRARGSSTGRVQPCTPRLKPRRRLVLLYLMLRNVPRPPFSWWRPSRAH